MKVKTFLRRLRRVLLTSTVTILLLITLLMLGVRFIALPYYEQRPHAVATLISDQIGLPVTLDALSIGWDGWSPELAIKNLRVYDARQQAPQIELPSVTLIISWRSLFAAELRMRALQIDAPVLSIRRAPDGTLSVGGFSLSLPDITDVDTAGEVSFAGWLQRQYAIVINGGTVYWHDEKRQAPVLTIRNFSFSSAQSLTGRYHLSLAGLLDTGTPTPFAITGERLPRSQNWRWQSRFDGANFPLLAQWIDLPFDIERGQGSLYTTLLIHNDIIESFSSELTLHDAAVHLLPDTQQESPLPPLEIKSASGTLSGVRSVLTDTPNIRYTLKTDNLTFVSGSGTLFPPTAITLTLDTSQAIASPNWLSAFDTAEQVTLDFQRLELKPLREILNSLPWLKKTRALLADSNIAGALENGHIAVSQVTSPPVFAAEMDVRDLSLDAMGSIPGVSNLSGHLNTDQSNGRFVFNTIAASLSLPKVFVETIPLTTLNGIAYWHATEDGLQSVILNRIRVNSDDLEVEVNGSWRADEALGFADLTANIKRAEAQAAYRYIPLIIPDSVRNWLHDSLLTGRADSGTMVLQGHLAHFPFADGDLPPPGLFSVDAHVSNGTMQYQPNWPRLENVEVMLHFLNHTMTINTIGASIDGATVTSATVAVPHLNADHPHLVIHGATAGDLTAYLRFVRESPVGAWIDNLLLDARGGGPATLALNIDIPLNDSDLTPVHVEGVLSPAGASLALAEAPPLSAIHGDIHFTEKGLSARQLKFTALGGSGSASLRNEKDTLIFTGSGFVDLAAVRQEFPHPLFDEISGVTDWKLNLSAGKASLSGARRVNWALDTTLAGVTSNLPAPLDEIAPLRIRHTTGQRETWGIDWMAPKAPIHVLIEREQKQNDWQITRIAAEASNIPFALPKDKRIVVAGTLPRFDFSGWMDLLSPPDQLPPITTMATASVPGGKVVTQHPVPNPAPVSAPPTDVARVPDLPAIPVQIDLTLGELTFDEQKLHRTRIAARTSNTGSELCAIVPTSCWRVDIDGAEIAGTLEWENATASGTRNGRLQAALSRLTLPEPDPEETKTAPVSDPGRTMTWPQFVLDIQQLMLGQRELGHLKLTASPEGNTWQINELALDTPDGHVSINGWWRPTLTDNTTSITLAARVSNVQSFLARLALPEGLIATNAQLEGTLQWRGEPTDFDLNTLSGALSVKVGSGRFTKIEPGLGRLIGVFSLQALPRRIVLDFRDVFTEGFAFDDIEGKTTIKNGVMTTDNLVLDGPAATVHISGQLNLINETQTLSVNVRPSISQGLSVGAAGASMLMMSTPVTAAAVGLGTLVGQLILNDPIGQMLSYEYNIEGSWSDPIVSKKETPPQPKTTLQDLTSEQ